MKNQKKLILEVKNIIVKFFKNNTLTDDMLTIPENVERMGFKLGIINFGMTAITVVFAFLLKITNIMIECKMILLGLCAFMLYRGQQVVNEIFRLFEDSENQKFEQIFEDEIVFRGSQIIGKTANKVYKYDSQNNLYNVMSNESILNSIKNYMNNLWIQKIIHKFELLQIISVTIMLFIAILSNKSISQIIFIPIIILFVLISFFCSAYISLNRSTYYKKHREYNNAQSLILNDLLRVPVIVKGDLDMRISKFQKTVVSSIENISKFHKKLNMSRLLVAIIETLSQYGIIILYILGLEWNSINLATITEITAMIVIVETALIQVGRIAETLNKNNERIIILEKEEKDMALILNVYHSENEKNCITKVLDNITISPFSIRYIEESKNDKPFTLISREKIDIGKGEVAILYGPSGSGKSTFMKMLTERIRLEKSTEIPSTSRFMFYDENLKFGSLSIFEELFCFEKNPDLSKMQKILENLHLWREIESSCVDVWKWMREKRFEQSLSNGQKQRLIIAKMLYWLDSEIDVMVFDECTSGLDNQLDSNLADAEKILEFIVKYSNSDKKRVIIISTHQNIDGFKENIKNEFKIKNFSFSNEGEYNIIKEF